MGGDFSPPSSIGPIPSLAHSWPFSRAWVDDMARATQFRDRRHARIYADWLTLPAWRALSGDGVKLLAFMLAQYRQGENGLTDFSVRQAGKVIGKSKSEGARALNELEACGWISVERVGKFQSRNNPSRYALATYPNDATGEPATLAFETWQPSQIRD
jgi:hypothetical protein